MDSDRPVRLPAAAAADPPRGPSRPRPASVFRAVVVSALAALAPASGCYQSYSDEDVPEGGEAADARDAEAGDEASPVYAIPDDGGAEDVSVVVYGMNDYGVPPGADGGE